MRTTVLVAGLATIAGTAPAQQSSAAPPAPDTLIITRNAAIATALRDNPQLEIARQQVAQARARKVQAVAIPDPDFTWNYSDELRFGRLSDAGSKNVELDLTVPFPDKFRLRNAVARADVQSAQFQYTLLQQDITAAVGRAYDDLLVARRHGRDFIEARALADTFYQKAQARFTAGTVPKLDVIRARVDLAQAENDLIQSDRDTRNTEAALNRLLGKPLGTAVVTADSLVVPDSLPALDPVVATALTTRLELADLQAQQLGARAATTLAREFWIPDFTLSAYQDYAQTGTTLYATGIALPFPIFFWQHTRGEIAESSHHERELAAAERDLRASIGQEVREAYAAAATALRQAVFLRDELLPSAREAYRVASVSYGLGGSSALEVLDARRALLDAEQQYADALAAASSARSDLERAMGRPLTTSGTRSTP